MNLQKLNRTIGFNWVDKFGLGVAVAVLALFLAVWLILLLAAGTAPTDHLTSLCVDWTIRAEAWVAFPIWFCARLLNLIVIHLVHSLRTKKTRISTDQRMGDLHTV
jgi:hypothetical protein